MSLRKKIIAVVGGVRPSKLLATEAHALGRKLVDEGYRIATGGLGGIMEAVSRGARSSTAWSDGLVIGVLPSLDATTANEFVDIAIPTGLNLARNVVLVSMADAVIAVGGGAGTLSEIALAWQHHKPVIALDLGEGWSSRLAGQVLDHRRPDPILRARDVNEVLAQLKEQIKGVPQS